MTRLDLTSYTLGSWAPATARPAAGSAAFREALSHVGHPVHVVSQQGTPAVVRDGLAKLGAVPTGDELPLLGSAPVLTPGRLGDATFLRDYGIDAAYVAGEMANGIASEALVEAVTRAGYLGVFGAAGLTLERVTTAIDRLSASLAGKTWGINLIHSPDDQKLEHALVDLFLSRGLRFVSASAYLDLTSAIVRYRATGLRRDANGQIVIAHRVMAKVSRVEVARKFLEPAPERLLTELVAAKRITAEEAELAAQIPMADDVTAEADSGGHTDNRPLVLLLPALQALRDEVCATRRYTQRPRIGAAGGIATPASVATAFSMGAAYVVTGSINQATREAGTSDAVRELLAKATPTDVAMAPAADMFEMGVKVQVLTRGTLFAVRAARLYELYRTHESLAALSPAIREELETKFFRTTLEDAWAGCVEFFTRRDPAQLDKAAKDPKHQMALVFRAYLGQASRWANAGVADRKLDFQIWCGPAMGAFNAWTQGSALDAWNSRDAVLIARNLLVGACVLARVAALRSQGVVLPAEVEHFAPRTHAELDSLETLPLPAKRGEGRGEGPTSSPTREPIAIVGMGALFPHAHSLQDFWRLLRTGEDATGDIPRTHWSLDDFYDSDQKSPDRTYAKRGAFLPTTKFDPTEFGIPPAILEATDTSQLLSLVVARMALEDAGYGEDVQWDRSRASVLLGVTGTQELVISLGARLGHPHWKKALQDAGVDADTASDVMARIGASYVGWQENSFPGLLGNVVAGRIANRFDLGGTNCVVDAACASSLGALHLGMAELQSGRTDLVLTGGVDTLNDIFMHMCFSKTPALSPTGDARPFSDKADGTLLGEGLGMVVLKRLSDAERDGDRVYAVLRGMGTSSDGRAKSIYAPLPSGQARALQAAYRDANVTPRDITLLEAHGTGTKAGDAAEFEALDKVYRAASPDAPWCALGSVKSQVGHTKAAAGAAGLIKAALALHHRVLPPTIKIDRPNPALKIDSSPFALPTVARPWTKSSRGPRLAAVSSFGFGGSNFHTVLEEYGSKRQAPAWDGSVEVVTLSEPNAPALLARVRELQKHELVAEFARLSRESFRASDAHRLVLVLAPSTKPAELISAVIARLEKDATQAFTLPEGAAYGVGAPQGELAMLFPGQGAQHVDMVRELACLFPEVLEAVEANESVSAAVYPLPTFDAELQKAREAELTKTNMAQPALGAVERGLLAALGRFGVEPRLAAGHSYGELVALHSAGVFTAQALAEASLVRGRLMAGDGSDRGTMLAVLAPLAEVERMLGEEKLDVVLANRNTPSQGVLSGSREAIAAAEAACQRRSLRTTRLNVGAAFHSSLVAGAASEFAKALEVVPFAAPRIPVISNTTATAWPLDANEARALLAKQLASPVRFVEVVEALYASGARTFLEVGPKSALTGMVKATLGSRPFLATAIDAQSRRGGVGDFAFALAQLAAEGHAVRWSEWNKFAPPPRWKAKAPRTPKMVVPLTGANYRTPVAPIPPRAPKPAQVVTVAATPVTNDAFRLHDERIAALTALQEQTAKVHQRFLETQLAAQQSLMGALTNSLSLRERGEGRGEGPVFSPPTTRMPPSVPSPVSPSPGASRHPLPAAQGEGDSVEILLNAVAEATGYPRETLELKMDLEADLGIDSIKRVEILSLVSRRIPGAPAVNPEHLSGLRTLQQVADFVTKSAPVHQPVAAPKTATVDIKTTLLATVSELTGYPPDTLSLGMDLEADLGIDSIKRVEILSLLSRRIPSAPSVNPEKLGALKSLQQVHDFIASSVGAPPPVVVAAPAPSVNIETTLLATVSELTGYPTDTLSLGMDLEADLGIDSIKRVEILSLLSRRIPNAPQVNPEKLAGLKTLSQVRDFIANANPAVSPLSPTLSPVGGEGVREVKVTEGVSRRAVAPVRAPAPGTTAVKLPKNPILITRGDDELATALKLAFERAGHTALLHGLGEPLPAGPLGGVVNLAPKLVTSTHLKASLALARDVSAQLRGSAHAFFVTVTRRDGAFGFINAAERGLDGGLHGLSKSLQHEWPEVRSRAIDLSLDWPLETAASSLLDELTTDGPTELGLGPTGRMTLGLRTTAPIAERTRLTKGDVVLVTGGARGVTADCARALAKETGVTLVLLGRSPAPEAEEPWLAAARDDAALKKVLLERSPAGQRPSPKQLGELTRGILAARDIRASLEALRSLGLAVEYRQVDVRDPAAVSAVMTEARALGPIRGLVHGAGVLRDKRIEDKRDDDFDQVLDPKLGGLTALLEATRTDDLSVIALFSSVSGRFGRRGQSDYAVANQALVSMAQSEAAKRPHARVVALDWGPWAGGMVTSALEATFRSEGISLIPLEQGARAFVDEALASSNSGVEVVLGAGFGAEHEAAWSLARVERLDPLWPVLADHRLAGRSVVPLALVIEWFASVAKTGTAGVVLQAIEDVRVLKGVTLDGNAESVAVWTGPLENVNGETAMPIELRNAKDMVHVRALAKFGSLGPRPGASLAINGLAPFGTSVDTLYREQLFHGRSLEAIVAIDGLGEEGMTLTLRANPTTEQLLPGSARRWTLDPLTIDGVFQALIVWTRARLGAPSLPTRLDTLKWFAAPTGNQLRAAVKVRSIEGATVTSDIELLEADGTLIARLGGYQCTVSSTLARAFESELSSSRTVPSA